MACWCGLESQQPTCPQVRHIRRCAQVSSPCSVHSWHCRGVERLGGVELRPRPGARRSGTPRKSRRRVLLSMLFNDRIGAEVSATWVPSCWRSSWLRSYWPRWPATTTCRSPLALVVAGLLAGLIPGVPGIELNPDLVLFVILPPLLWSAGLESSYVAMRRNIRPIGLLAVGLPLATTFAVGHRRVPDGARADDRGGADARRDRRAARCGVGDRDRAQARPAAPDDDAAGRREPAQRRDRADRVQGRRSRRPSAPRQLGAAGSATFALAAAGGVVVGWSLGSLIVYIRCRLDDPLVESADRAGRAVRHLPASPRRSTARACSPWSSPR